MFEGYVKRSELDAERARRIRAEAEVGLLRADNIRLLTSLDNQRKELNEAHADQMQQLLNHLAPLQQGFDVSASPGNGSKSSLELLADAYSEPAIGGAAIEAKRNKIAKLEKLVNNAHARVATDDRVVANDNGDLSADEEARIAAKLEAGE